MQQALDAELSRLEITAIKADLFAAALVIALSVMAHFAVSSGVAVFNAVCAGATALVFAAELRWARGPRAMRVLQWVNPLIEITAPTVLLVAGTLFVSAGAVLTSSPAVVAYALPLVVSVLRLRPALCVAVGVVGAVEYLAFVHVLLMPRLSSTLLELGNVRVPMVYANSGVILAGGIVASLVSLALRSAVSAAHREVRAHDLFGKYRLEEPVAEGGMGVVFRAIYCPEGGFERRVAVKRIHGHLARNPRFVQAFRNEAALCSRLAHPNIVQVLDFGMLEDTYFFAMEYVDGWPLSQVLHRAGTAGVPIPLPVVAHVGREILAGLEYAQQLATDTEGELLRIIHRDLTPSNVLLTRGGQVKIADFGIAKALHASDGTSTRTVQGKLAYMAPEQARAERLDVRCDLWAVGVVLWELLVGRPLFRRATDSATLLALLQEPIPTPGSAAGRDVPPEWSDLVMRALERDPARRWGTATEMKAVLDGCLERAPLHPGELARFLVAVDRAPPPPPEMHSTTGTAGGTLPEQATTVV